MASFSNNNIHRYGMTPEIMSIKLKAHADMLEFRNKHGIGCWHKLSTFSDSGISPNTLVRAYDGDKLAPEVWLGIAAALHNYREFGEAV